MADSGGGIPPPYYLHSPSAFVGDTSMFSHTDVFAPTLQFPHSGVSGRAAAAPAPVEAPRRKRGRPRKYGPQATTTLLLPSSSQASASPRKKAPSALPLLPAASSSASAAAAAATASPRKKPDASQRPTSQKPPKEALGIMCKGFTPHTICIGDGEDVAQKILSFMHQLKQSVCIISASGSVCDVSLRQPANMGGLVLHEGLFEIVSFCGSFLYIATGGTATRRGGMSICLIGADGRMIGGGVGGCLKAAGPVQVIASSFLIDQATLDTPEATETSNTGLNSDSGAATLTQPTGIQSQACSTRIPDSRPLDNYQIYGSGTSFVQHLQHLQPEWQGSAGLDDIGAYHSQEGRD